MITIHASAVCRVRDGYTGQPLEGSKLLCALDGAPVRPLAKPGGYLVLLDLSPGPHRLSLRGHGYQEEWVDLLADANTQEMEVTMKPGPGYPFRGRVTRLELMVTEGGRPAPQRQLWLASPARSELKIAQTKARTGESQFRLYSKSPAATVPPGTYLIADGENSEIIHLRGLEEEIGTLSAPLVRDHGRGRSLLPAQCYRTDGEGRLTAVFQTACTVEVYGESAGLLASLPLEEGENRREIAW